MTTHTSDDSIILTLGKPQQVRVKIQRLEDDYVALLVLVGDEPGQSILTVIEPVENCDILKSPDGVRNLRVGTAQIGLGSDELVARVQQELGVQIEDMTTEVEELLA